MVLRRSVALAALTSVLALPATAEAPSASSSALARLSDRGPSFATYDGDVSFDQRGRDWPVVLVFAGNATVGKVKAGLRKAGYTRGGHVQYLGYTAGHGGARFDGDHGLKTRCDANGTDVHLRIYAPAPADHFADPEFGSFVVATAHLDRADGCGKPPKLFGFSEIAEARIAAAARRRGWTVSPNRIPLGNAEPYRRDTTDRTHLWLSDGRATLVTVR